MSAANSQQRVMAAAFEPLNSKERLREGLEGGAGAVLPLGVVHGFFALGGLFTENWESLLIHGGLTGLAVLAGLAVVKGRTIWPSLAILAWLGVEIFGGASVFGYRMGGSVLNLFAIPLAILGVRASFRRRAVASGRRGPLPAVTPISDK